MTAGKRNFSWRLANGCPQYIETTEDQNESGTGTEDAANTS